MSDNVTQECLDKLEQTIQGLDNDGKEEFLEEIISKFWLNYKEEKDLCNHLINNLKTALKQISKKEHQSGLFRAVLASVCGIMPIIHK